MTISAFLAKRPGLANSIRPLWQELRSNRRAALGVAAIAVLLAGSGVVALRAATERSEANYRDQAAMLRRIDAIAHEGDWHQRATVSAALRKRLVGTLWQAESEGLAQANLQDWISGVGRAIEMPMLDVRVESTKAKDLPADMRQMTATITAQPSEMAVIDLLARLEQAPHLTVVTRLHVRQQPGPMLELVLVGYARITGTDKGGGT
jgi:hypothetical protein